MKQIHLYVSDELHETFRQIAFKQRKSMSQIIVDILSATKYFDTLTVGGKPKPFTPKGFTATEAVQQPKLCKHGFIPKLCKHQECRK